MAEVVRHKFQVYQQAKSLASLSLPLWQALKELEIEYSPDFQEFPTIAFATIGEGIIDRWDEISEPERVSVFSGIEALMTQPLQITRDAVATGLVEALNHRVFWDEMDGAFLDSYLGPETRKYWIAYDNFWGASTPGINET
jgi:hypothetical protein